MNMALVKKKRTAISLEKKLEIIEYTEKNVDQKQTAIAERFDIKAPTLCGILKEKTKIRDIVSQQQLRVDTDARKRIRQTNFDEVDGALIIWFRQYYYYGNEYENLSVDGNVLLQKAAEFAKAFKYEQTPSHSWIDRWKKRWNIGKLMKVSEAAGRGVGGGVHQGVIVEWREAATKDILARYMPENIFNCNKTVLFWQMLPSECLGFIGEQQKGTKPESKSRIILVVGANMSGSEKMPLLTIGERSKSRALSKITKTPIKFTANKKAWMRNEFFEAELQDFDSRMKREGRKVAMVLNNCHTHPQLKLENTELFFLPPNSTSVTQPMDAGIIQNLKFHYRRLLSSRYLNAAEQSENFKWDILDCLLALNAGWDMVTSSTIADCWQKAGFKQDGKSVDAEAAVSSNDAQALQSFLNVWEQLAERVGKMPTLDDYINIDSNIDIQNVLTYEEIVSQVIEEHEKDSNADEDTCEDPSDPPTLQEAYKALDALKRFSLTIERDDLLNSLSEYENFLAQESGKRKFIQKNVAEI